jgi:YHS domain-containing protein
VASDELVQDPVCKIFVPRRNALKLHKNGTDYFFCSEGCRKKFLK